MEPEICTKMLKNLSEKLRAKFPVTTHGCSMVKMIMLSQNFLELEASPVEFQSLVRQQNDKKRRKERKGKKTKKQKA